MLTSSHTDIVSQPAKHLPPATKPTGAPMRTGGSVNVVACPWLDAAIGSPKRSTWLSNRSDAFEATDYRSANRARLCDVAKALDVEA